jgi:hypothetical protein
MYDESIGRIEQMAFNILQEHVDALRAVVDANRNNSFFQRRYRRNVLGPPQTFTKEEFWRQQVACLSSSMQKSGPESALSRFLRLDPFPLALNTCSGREDLSKFAQRTISANGLRFGPTIGRRFAANLLWLDDGGWGQIEDQFNILCRLPRNAPAAECIRKERHEML